MASETGASPTGASQDDEGEPDLGAPPRDADDWTDEQWLAWLSQGDDDEPQAETPTLGRFQRSPGGRMLGNAMLGVAEAMYGAQRPQIVVQAEAPGDPLDEDLSVHLDPDSPERSTVVRRRRRGGG